MSKHHYALELVRRGHRVLFYGPPEVGPLRLSLEGKAGPGQLLLLHGPRVAPGLRLMPPRLRRALEARWLAGVERLVGESVDVVWLFENSRFFDMGFAGDRLKIYHQVDLKQDFHPERAAASADLAIAISAPIERRIASAARQFLRITHGCPTVDAADSAPSWLNATFARYRFNAVITGNLSIPFLDNELLADLVEEHPDCGFHLVGRYTPGRGLHALISNAANAIFWGQHTSDAIPSFLEQADVLLVAYQTEEYIEQLANPHKIMEYLASGRCVLASRTLEYEGRPDLVETAWTREDFKSRFAEITEKPSIYNTPDLVARRQAFAADNTYPRQLERIITALGPRGGILS